MAKVVSIHSFRGGTGKSNLTANLAVNLAEAGKRVGIIDADIQSPGIHVIFNLNEGTIANTLDHYLWGKCQIEDAAYKVYSTNSGGSVHLVPASIKPNDIARILREKYDANDMNDAFRKFIIFFNLDYLFIDTHPGLNEETLLSVSISDILLIILRPDQQDFQGTKVTVDVARRLRVPEIRLVLNKIPQPATPELKKQVEDTYNCSVVAMLPLATEVAQNASSGIFTLRFPEHPFTQEVRGIVQLLLGD